MIYQCKRVGQTLWSSRVYKLAHKPGAYVCKWRDDGGITRCRGTNRRNALWISPFELSPSRWWKFMSGAERLTAWCYICQLCSPPEPTWIYFRNVICHNTHAHDACASLTAAHRHNIKYMSLLLSHIVHIILYYLNYSLNLLNVSKNIHLTFSINILLPLSFRIFPTQLTFWVSQGNYTHFLCLVLQVNV